MIIRKVVKHALGDGSYYWLELACGHEKTTRGLPRQTRCRLCEQDIGVQIADAARRSKVDDELPETKKRPRWGDRGHSTSGLTKPKEEGI